jgi:hypothetical protein
MIQSIMMLNSARNAAAAVHFPQQTADSLVTLLSFYGAMHHPLYAGDTTYPGLKIGKLTLQRTTASSKCVQLV